MNDRNDTITPALTAEQLAQVNRLATVARFVSALAHELNNSLQIMSGLVELLVDREDLPADVLVRLGRVGAQADLASGKLKQVIGYVREPATEGERLELGTIVDRALTLRSYELGRSGISVGWELPLERFPVRGNRRDLQQAVLNLLANAQEALAPAPTRELHVHLAQSGGVIRLVDCRYRCGRACGNQRAHLRRVLHDSCSCGRARTRSHRCRTDSGRARRTRRAGRPTDPAPRSCWSCRWMSRVPVGKRPVVRHRSVVVCEPGR